MVGLYASRCWLREDRDVRCLLGLEVEGRGEHQVRADQSERRRRNEAQGRTSLGVDAPDDGADRGRLKDAGQKSCRRREGRLRRWRRIGRQRARERKIP